MDESFTLERSKRGMYNIKLIGLDSTNEQLMINWIGQSFSHQSKIYSQSDHEHQIDIFIICVSSPFDWVTINRLRKKHIQSKFIILLDETLLKTSQIAVKLRVHALHLIPVKKPAFLKSLSIAMDELTDMPVVRENLLRKLMYGEIKTEEELAEYQSFAKIDHIPNIVCLLQGNDKAQSFIENEEGKRVVRSHVRSVIKNHLSHWVKDVYYVSYSRYLAVLFHIPYVYKSIREWEEIRYYLLKVIKEIENEYGIMLHVGIGSVYNNPLNLDQPYQEARKALNESLKDGSPLKFYEELTNDEHLQKCIEYISNNYNDDLSIKRVASQVHLSHTYFSRLFKKELGVSFVEYVTNVRVKRAKWLLSNTNDSIESIAEQVGFNTPNYFSSIFKKNVGVSPSEYREQHLINS
jgi:two-component system response regulator YesN